MPWGAALDVRTICNNLFLRWERLAVIRLCCCLVIAVLCGAWVHVWVGCSSPCSAVAVFSWGECGPLLWFSCDDGKGGGMFGRVSKPRLSLSERGFSAILMSIAGGLSVLPWAFQSGPVCPRLHVTKVCLSICNASGRGGGFKKLLVACC